MIMAHENISDKAEGFECSLCQTRFTFRTNLNRHNRNIHKRGTARGRASCSFPGCTAKFYHQTKLLSHFETAHGQITEKMDISFPTAEKFLAWKTQEEKENFVLFTKQRGDIDHLSVVHQHYICQRDGSARSHTAKNKMARKTDRRPRKGVVKTNLVCPARMLVRRCKKSGRVDVAYYKSHSHAVSPDDAVHHPLPDGVRKEIRDKLKSGVSVEHIHEEYQCRACETQDARLRRINRSQIRAIQRRLEKKEKLARRADLPTPHESRPQSVVIEALHVMDNSSSSGIDQGSSKVAPAMTATQDTTPVGGGTNFTSEMLCPQPLSRSDVAHIDYARELQRMLQEILMMMEQAHVRDSVLPHIISNMEEMLALCKQKANPSGIICNFKV
ncbi:uncharacterized protein [Diadema antillarum]|uniref:uncharacterized protein n=1 Tax=Diadema antillarum TaxID=105358 RepID=UPI003A880CAB